MQRFYNSPSRRRWLGAQGCLSCSRAPLEISPLSPPPGEVSRSGGICSLRLLCTGRQWPNLSILELLQCFCWKTERTHNHTGLTESLLRHTFPFKIYNWPFPEAQAVRGRNSLDSNFFATTCFFFYPKFQIFISKLISCSGTLCSLLYNKTSWEHVTIYRVFTENEFLSFKSQQYIIVIIIFDVGRAANVFSSQKFIAGFLSFF